MCFQCVFYSVVCFYNNNNNLQYGVLLGLFTMFYLQCGREGGNSVADNNPNLLPDFHHFHLFNF